MRRFSYSDYEATCRSGGYHTARRYLSMLVPIFKDCKNVLDIGCGQGIFLQLLQSQAIPATGVDSDEQLLTVARQNGAKVVQADALEYLRTTPEEFDGMFCSHLIEHLPFDAVVNLLETACQRLANGGRFVLVFPNPASLNMQLNFFWRDPTHVRFYQRDLIAAVLTHYGLTIDTTFPEATSWRWASLAEALPPQGLWSNFKRSVRSKIRRQLEIDDRLLEQPEDVLIVAHKPK
jgi:2-polyprenyl-3-methyl-5-hydroxy-6-metoxy-1,4-benzoquinol methylase